MLDQEEVLKAISLEEKALEDFKRRKNSLPQPQTSSGKSSSGKINFRENIQQVLKISSKFQTLAGEKRHIQLVRQAY